MIDGVVIKKLVVHADERGRVIEILRKDDPVFEQFGQVYMTTAYSGVVKAWHYHKKQHDIVTVVHGMMKIVLYDPRQESPTHKQINEFFIGVHNPILLKIPPLVYHGFKCISEHEAIVVSCPTFPFNAQAPDEYRLPYNTSDIPYTWERRNY